jgi:Tfp pilus assembly protein PilF
LPFVLLLLDYWPLERLEFVPTPPETETTARSVPTNAHESSPARVFFYRCAEKLPLLLLAAGSAVLTLKAQALDSEIKFVSVSSRIANALVSCGTYLSQMVWPSKLAIFYPYRDRSIFSWPVLAGTALVGLVSALVVWQTKKRPYLAVGWFWYLGTLVPVVGLVHVGDISHADRYTYVPLIGVFIAIVWGAADLGARLQTRSTALRYAPYAMITAAGLAAAALAVTTTRDISYWHDAISISEQALAATGPNCLMERALGEAFYNQGRMDEAVQHLTSSIQIQPTDTAFFDIGTLKLQQTKLEEAAFYYQKALQYPGEPQMLAQIHNNLAVLEMQSGSMASAEKDFKDSVALDPSSPRHHVAYGWLLAKQGRYDEAIAQYQQAIKTGPDALTYFSLGTALEEQHERPQAAEAYRQTLVLAPGFREAQLRLKAIGGPPQ